jgi:hypothetical protein
MRVLLSTQIATKRHGANCGDMRLGCWRIAGKLGPNAQHRPSEWTTQHRWCSAVLKCIRVERRTDRWLPSVMQALHLASNSEWWRSEKKLWRSRITEELALCRRRMSAVGGRVRDERLERFGPAGRVGGAACLPWPRFLRLGTQADAVPTDRSTPQRGAHWGLAARPNWTPPTFRPPRRSAAPSRRGSGRCESGEVRAISSYI